MFFIGWWGDYFGSGIMFSSHTEAWPFCGTVLDFFFSQDHAYLQNKKSSLCISVDSNLEMDTRLIKKSCFAELDSFV